MCELCEENGGNYVSCPDCGCLICMDVTGGVGDDVLRPAYVTYAGDLACSICGQRADRDFEEEADEMDFGFFEDVMGDFADAQDGDEDEDFDTRREEYVARRIREHEEAGNTTYVVGDFYEEYDTGDLRAPRITAPGVIDDRPALDDDLPF
ncbi:MAG TPA: hypothetical protein PKD09_10695 [Aggregatilinea sp.]|uniref:hypothetical protein n=1 Tax=Aggregatilinea sp. TaxID=2806333 RepID=UPI002C17CD10|nr:hypothetical protein [Aggregatilinea sp.]HML22111.1 hypothetical protein [Aggregatilinea sp.]